MSQEKAQLIAPIDSSFSVPGLTVSGVLTATTFDGTITGVADSITQGKNLNVGVITALSFSGNLTGDAGGLIGSPNTVAGVVTANSFVGGITGNITGDVIGNASGIGASIKQGNNLNVGIATAVEWYGDGSGVTGAGSSAYVAQEITATGDETIIDLSYGNVIYYKGAVDTTVGFASTSAAEQLTFIRNTSPTFDVAYNESISTAAVDFNGSDQRLTLAATADFHFGTADFTMEAFVNRDADTNPYPRPFAFGPYYSSDDTVGLCFDDTDYPGKLTFTSYRNRSQGTVPSDGRVLVSSSSVTTGTWYHIAVTRTSGTFRLFIDGVLEDTNSSIPTRDLEDSSTNTMAIAGTVDRMVEEPFDGKVSNVRIINGTSLYTENFLPPSAELTNVTNTKLLCCQSSSSTTTAAVTPGTITADNSPTAGSYTVAYSGTNTLSNGTITWPDRVKWNNDTTPTLFTNPRDSASQIFRFTTVDTGLNYNAWEEIKSDSQDLALFIWGDNTNGGLGQNQPTPTKLSSPTQISGAWKTLVHKSDNGATQSCGAIKTDDTLWVWGRNGRYQLGLSNTTAVSSPTQLPGSWSSVKFANAAQGVKTDGTMWSWGYGNSNGAMAQNEGNVQRSSPKQVGTDTDWSHVGKSGAAYFLGIKTDDTLWICGKGSAGRLGLNNLTQRSSPTQLPGSWSQAFACSDFLGGLKTDGTLWSWGYNSYGNLGQGDSTKQSSPVQIPGTWSDTTGGYNAMGGVKTDGTLWTWGYNAKGNLGHNNLTNYNSPKQLPGTTWRSVDIGYQWTVATKTDGTMYSWGSNAYGRLGIDIAGYPSAGDRSSPTQLPGTTWGEQVSLGERVSVETKLG